ncbi:MAG: amino acid ABC transporter permease [Synechococcus sp. ELA057]
MTAATPPSDEPARSLPPWLRLRRLRQALFATPADGALTVALLALLGWLLQLVVGWALHHADWAVVQLNSALLLVGRYPPEQQWRLWLLAILLAAQAGLSWGVLRATPRPDRRGLVPLWPRSDRVAVVVLALLALLLPRALDQPLPVQIGWWGLTTLLILLRTGAARFCAGRPADKRRLVPALWPLLYVVGLWLIGGGLGLAPVAPSDWGGLLLTLLMASFAMALSFPLGILLALGRRSSLPLLRWGSVAYIEFIRAAPLITLLFVGQNILGFVLPGGMNPDRVWRAAWVLTLFAAAYLAEAVRAGLAGVPRGQSEAARTLGLSLPQTLIHVVIPQALRIALPALMGQLIALLQDTTLLSLIGLLDLLGMARSIMANPRFLGNSTEMYLTLALLYWICCVSLGLASRALEQRLASRPSSPARFP